MRRVVDQIKEVVASLMGLKAPPASTGGLALAARNVAPPTHDVDFRADADGGDQLDVLLMGLGYRCVHRSDDAANYLRDDEGLHLLYALDPKPYAC